MEVIQSPRGMTMKDIRRSMAFIDGTNFAYRVKSEKVKLNPETPYQIVAKHSSDASLLRVYFYTTEQRVEELKTQHCKELLKYCRIVLGQEIKKDDGNIKEKGVDALLVADLIYHSAQGNIDEAIIMTHDTDFMHALKRVEDFGVTTTLLALFNDAPERLRESCDRYFLIKQEDISYYINKD